MGDVRAIAVLVPLLALAVGCARRPSDAATPRPEPAGQVAYRFLEGDGAELSLPPDQEIEPPHAAGALALPEFPEEALREGLRLREVVVRITIGPDGALEVADTPGAGAQDPRFRAAVEHALSRWRFVPAVWRRFEPGEDLDGDGAPDYRRAVEQQAVAVWYDVRFTFSVVRGRPAVSAASGP
jgi:hypothetical protein